MQSAESILESGAQTLARELAPLGFQFLITSKGNSSGGQFAEGRFKNGDRELWLSFRYSLGLVRYRKGDAELTHSQFMRALGLSNVARYPGFSDDPLAAFHDLASDLRFCGAFLENSGDAFLQITKTYVDPPSGFASLG